MTRKDFIRQYLFQLVVRYETLEAERQDLLDAAARLTAIQEEKQALIADAQDALDKFNAVSGTSFTLQQVRQWYDANRRTINEPAPSPETP